MKFRPVLIICSIVFTFCLSSCTREYICQCTIKYSGQPGLPDSVIREYPVKDTKKNAQSVCEGNSGTTETNGITATEKCKLY
jgi:hypothetical protein